jgi:hypothetical protein
MKRVHSIIDKHEQLLEKRGEILSYSTIAILESILQHDVTNYIMFEERVYADAEPRTPTIRAVPVRNQRISERSDKISSTRRRNRDRCARA